MNLNPVIIETKRLKLTGLTPQEMAFIFDYYNKEEIKKLLGHKTEEDFQKEAFKHKNGYAAYNRSFLLFLLTEKISNSIIGRCGLHNWNAAHHRAEIGYHMIDENFKGKGLMTEAVSAIIDYGFNQLNLHRIEALVGSSNIPSLKILAHHHFVKEGVLRQHFFTADKYEDSVVFSILYHEYMANKNDKTTNP